MTVIALMTDFGTKDGNVGVMKGVIAKISPKSSIVDLSHEISPQNILEASLILARTYAYFPENSVFVVVIDPGVGTSRRPIAAKIGSYYFVLPDNGILTPVIAAAENQKKPIEIYVLNKGEFWLEKISNLFHGRDIFAPVGAYIANGVRLENLGTRINNPIRVTSPAPKPTNFGFAAEIIHIDHFGNISTNVLIEDLKTHHDLVINLHGYSIPGLFSAFGDQPPGSLIALIGSTGSLIISVVNGNAAERIGANVGDQVEVHFQD